MILGDALTPMSGLSSAFLAPKTPLHLQFAYYESALAVDFLVGRYGLVALKGVLDDLGAGTPINEALPGRTKTSLDQLDRDFAEFARTRARSIAPTATWEEPDLPADADSDALATWLEAHPRSFAGLRRLGARLVAEERWPRAKVILEQVRQLFPEYVGPENAYMLLATVHRRLSERAEEHKVLEDLAARDGDAGPAYTRLMELDEASGDWRGVAKNARRMLAVNPLIPAPHRALGRASEALGDLDEAVACYRAAALLDDSDPAENHYRLARLLRKQGKPAEAKREVLRSLEEAPRFGDGHQLLLELVEADKAPPAANPPSRPASAGRSR
jgi:tetratricopeptide (TPR) repeat protein